MKLAAAILVAGALPTILALALFRDVPPFLHYVWLLAIGIGLLLSAAPAEERVGVSAQPVASGVKVAGAEPHHHRVLDKRRS